MTIHLPTSPYPRIVIVGSGFGGIQLAKSLRGKPYQVVLLDRNNYHTFLPLLYQVATAGLEPDAIAEPVREMFNGNQPIHFRMADAQRIDPVQNQLETSIGTVAYDFLVLACGSGVNFYGNEELARHALPMKSIQHALALRSRLLENGEKALELPDKAHQLQQLNIVIAGGGPTGVELAGAICELRDMVLTKDYPELPIRQMQIHLVEANHCLLHTMAKASSQKAYQYLHQMGVHIHLNKLVTSFDGAHVALSDGTTHLTKTVFWTAGVKGITIPGVNPTSVGAGNRYLVNEYNQIQGYTNLFAIGDTAFQPLADFPKGLPGLAPVAIQQGKHLAVNFNRLRDQQPLKPFQYHNKGVMAVVGRHRAVVELPRFSVHGFVAWLLWLGVHLLLLVGFRNKSATILNWIVDYFSYSRASRLITHNPDTSTESVTEGIDPTTPRDRS